MLEMLPKPAIIAHRGASAHAPENTLASFELALRQGADAIELDAKLTRDGKVVVFHDQSLNRTTGSSGRVKEMTLLQLRKLDAGSHFDIAFKGEQIPTLEEVLGAVGRLTFTYIELTNYLSPADALPERVAELVRRLKLQGRVIFSSYNPLALIRIRRLIPQAPIGLLALPGSSGALCRGWFGRLLNYQVLLPASRDVSASLVERTHRRGNYVHVYTCNQAREMRRLLELGVDGVITDDPVMARQVLVQEQDR